MATSPRFEGGKWIIDKDPDDKRYYVYDITDDLATSNTTAQSVVATPIGVQVLEGPVIQGTKIVVKLGGMATGQNAVNNCTMRVTCANTEQFDRTIHFNNVDN